MKVNFERPLLNLDGKIIEEGEEGKKKPLLLRDVSVGALTAIDREDNPPADEKVKRWNLALTVNKAREPVELEVEDVALLKKLVGKHFGALVVGQAYSMLEGN